MRNLLAAAIVMAAATPVFADFTQGTVLAYDRVAHVIVMDDKTVWTLSEETVVPEGLEAGDLVKIEFTGAGDDGIASVEAIERL